MFRVQRAQAQLQLFDKTMALQHLWRLLGAALCNTLIQGVDLNSNNISIYYITFTNSIPKGIV